MQRSKVSMKDIAVACHTTVPTVSYILSGSQKRYVNTKLREDVLRCAAQMGYIPKHPAKTFKTLAVVLPMIENSFFRRVTSGIESVCKTSGYLPTFYHTNEDPRRESEILDHIARSAFSGCLLIPSEGSFVTQERMNALRFPSVVAERPLLCDADYDFVSMDNFDAGYAATKELIAAGHRNIGFLTYPTSATTLLGRQSGYMRALEEANILYRNDYIVFGAFTEEAGYHMAQELLAQQSSITAMVVAYHVQAVGCMRYFRDAHISIPDQLSLVVVGDPSWIDIVSPSLTHVTLPGAQIGSSAARRLIHKIESSSSEQTQHIVIKGELVQGGSVAAPL